MPATLALALLALQLLGAGTPSDTYLDPLARQLVEQARERRSSVEGRIERYTTLARSRVTIGLRALRRDRTFYRCEAASRIDWKRADTIRVDLLGAREVAPMFTDRVKPGDGDCGGSAFDPVADRLGLALGDGMSLEDSSFLHHPLAAGSERHYRFRSGGTTSMRLADGTVIRLLELQVLPRRSEPFLVSGSLWLEDRSYAVVRAVLRLARPFDYERDFARRPDADLDDEEEDEDELPRFLRPLRADLRFVTVEYGLWEQQWWLPRLMAFEGEAEVGRLLAVPLRMERSYAEYEITALPAGTAIPDPVAMPADSVCKGSGRAEDDDEEEEDEENERHVTTVEVDSEGPSVERRRRVGCECSGGRCQVVVTRAAVDSLELVHSELLPPSIFSEGNVFISDREMSDLLSHVQEIRLPPWQLAPVTWRTGLQGFDLVRYNRVEGLSVGAAANVELGGASLDAIVRLGIADLQPNVELAASRRSGISHQRVAVYRRLVAVGPSPSTLGFGSSLSALLFGRDDGDYFRAWGVELGRRATAGPEGLSWRAFAEFQRRAEKHTDFSLAKAFGDANFRPNIEAQAAEQAGVEVRLRGSRGSDPTGWRAAATAGVLASTGTFSFAQPRLTLSGAAPLAFDLIGGVEVNGGTTLGTAPLQSWYYLGGGRTVRGYDGNAARGETFWTTRGEIGTAGPGARIVLFSDAGWAGASEELRAEPSLLSVGAGLSVLDGLLRIDLAKPLREVGTGKNWRVELQVDAGL